MTKVNNRLLVPLIASLIAVTSAQAAPTKGNLHPTGPSHNNGQQNHGRQNVGHPAPRNAGRQWQDNKRDHVDYQRDGRPLVHSSVTRDQAHRWVVESRMDRRGYNDLPPGVAKNLARGKPLPPGIAKKAPPPYLVQRLPIYQDYEWHSVGRDLVLLYRPTGIIANIVIGVF